MSWRRTLFLFFIFASLAGFYYVKVGRLSFPKPDVWAPDPSSRRKPILAMSSTEELLRLSFDLSEDASSKLRGRVVLERKGEKQWRITSPVSAPAEAVVADGLLSVLKLMPRVRELSFAKLSLGDYGLDRPRQRICVETGQKSRCLRIGSEGALSKGVYAKWEDEDKFFLASSELVRAFDRTLYSLRQKQVLSFTESQIDSIHVRHLKQELVIQREGNHWLLKKPDLAILGPLTVEALYSKLIHLYAKDFIDGPPAQNPELGLTAPSFVIRVFFSDGSQQTLVRGGQAPGLDAYYVQNSEHKSVFLVSIGKFRELERAFEAIHPF